MEIKVNLNGKRRKVLAEAVGSIVGVTPAYKGPPGYSYEVGKVIVDRNAAVVIKFESINDVAFIRRLLDGLKELGFEPSTEEPFDELDNIPDELTEIAINVLAPDADEILSKRKPDTPIPEWLKILPEYSFSGDLPFPELDELTDLISEDDTSYPVVSALSPCRLSLEPDKLVIQIPSKGFDSTSLENLLSLVNSKASLIKKAIRVENLPIGRDRALISFPWFPVDLSKDEITAYSHFICALCDMAKRQKRVLATEKPTDNDKFTFRLFLVRLGLIGDEYAATRRILLRHLTGNGSWKNAEARKSSVHSATSALPETAIDNSGTTPASEPPKRRFSLRNFINNIKTKGY